MMPWWAWLLLGLAAWCACSLPFGLLVARCWLPNPHEPVVHEHGDELRARRDLQARAHR